MFFIIFLSLMLSSCNGNSFDFSDLSNSLSLSVDSLGNNISLELEKLFEGLGDDLSDLVNQEIVKGINSLSDIDIKFF